eukprot:TRINITY_DN21234_c0_g1_i1.p1 TRINITY_DN21234_c0_g1~~TRINITY_DN21234_c0_g1_i1.p1  ORF type:complete len:952 (-),score=177.51 TRINITY_DN21234_c0_g1_i1:170-3025(-)
MLGGAVLHALFCAGCLVAVTHGYAGPRKELVLLGKGCCESEVVAERYAGLLNVVTGMTLAECQEECEADPLCMAFEHDPFYQGLCSVFSLPATALACPLTEKVCYTVRLPNAPEPVVHGVDESGLSLHELRRWHAREFWRERNCFGGKFFERVRQLDLNAFVFGEADAMHLWSAAHESGSLGGAGVEDFNTESYFDTSTNEFRLSMHMVEMHEFTTALRGDITMDFSKREKGFPTTLRGCAFGVLYLLYAIMFKFHLLGEHEEATKVAWRLRVMLWSTFAGPESHMDLMQSADWKAHYWDMVVATMDDDEDGYWWMSRYNQGGKLTNDSKVLSRGAAIGRFTTYEMRKKFSRLPPPYIPSLLSDLPRTGSFSSGQKEKTTKRTLVCGGNAAEEDGAPARVRIGSLGIVRQMQMHQLSAMQAAWAGLCGAHRGPPEFDVQFVYTPHGPMSEYEKGQTLQQRTSNYGEAHEVWMDMTIRFEEKMRFVDKLTSLEEVQADLEPRFASGGSLHDVDVLICGEPVYVCTALDRILQSRGDNRPLLAHLGMALMHHPAKSMTVVAERDDVARFITHFLAMLVRPFTFVSVANRITMEQVFWQVGVRLPIAHFAGHHLKPLPQAQRRQDNMALLFRSKFPVLATVFLKSLKLFARREDFGVGFADMNELPSMSWSEISEFKACVLLPHNVHLIRTADLYALEVTLFIPAEPFLFQFIYPGSNLYAGHGGLPSIRLGLDRDALQKLHRHFKIKDAGYKTGLAPTAAKPGELLPREKFRNCPHRFPFVSSCNKVVNSSSPNDNERIRSEACPWGTYNIDEEVHTALGCEETVKSEKSLRSQASSICSRPLIAEEEMEEFGPALDPFDHLYGEFNPWCNLDSYRYWYGFTDYALMRGVQRFSGIPDLLVRLQSLYLEEGADERWSGIQEEMRQHQQLRLRETEMTWSQALTTTMQPEKHAA